MAPPIEDKCFSRLSMFFMYVANKLASQDFCLPVYLINDLDINSFPPPGGANVDACTSLSLVLNGKETLYSRLSNFKHDLENCYVEKMSTCLNTYLKNTKDKQI